MTNLLKVHFKLKKAIIFLQIVNQNRICVNFLIEIHFSKVVFLLILELKTGNRLAQEILSQHAIDVNFAPINVYWRRMEVRVSSALANVTALYNGAIFFLKSHSNYHQPMQ